jgi:gas vesicle protein
MLGLTAGILIGAAASMMVMPQMDSKTRRRVDRTSRKIVNSAGDFINDIKDYAR